MSKSKFKYYTKRYKAVLGMLSNLLNSPDNEYVQDIIFRDPAPTNIVEEMSLDDMIVSLSRDIKNLAAIDPKAVQITDNAMRFEQMERRIEKVKELSEDNLNEEKKYGEVNKTRYREYKYISDFLELYSSLQSKLDKLDYEYYPEEEVSEAFDAIDTYLQYQNTFITTVQTFNGFVDSDYYDESALPEEITKILSDGSYAEAIIEYGHLEELKEAVLKFLNEGVQQIGNITVERTEAMQDIRNKRNLAIIAENERYDIAVKQETNRHIETKKKAAEDIKKLRAISDSLEDIEFDTADREELEYRVNLQNEIDNLLYSFEDEDVWYEQSKEELEKDHARRLEKIQNTQGDNQNEIEDVTSEIVGPLRAMLQVLRSYAVYLDDLDKAVGIITQNALAVGNAQHIVYERQAAFKDRIEEDKISMLISLDKFENAAIEKFKSEKQDLAQTENYRNTVDALKDYIQLRDNADKALADNELYSEIVSGARSSLKDFIYKNEQFAKRTEADKNRAQIAAYILQLFSLKEQMLEEFSNEFSLIDNTFAGSFEIKTYAEQLIIQSLEFVPETYVEESEEDEENYPDSQYSENISYAGPEASSQALSDNSVPGKSDPIYAALSGLGFGVSKSLDTITDDYLLNSAGYNLKSLTRALAAVALAIVLRRENASSIAMLENKSIANRLVAIYENLPCIKDYASKLYYAKLDPSAFVLVAKSEDFYNQINSDLANLTKK